MIGELEKRINKMLFLRHAGKDLDDDYEQKRVHQIIEIVKKEFEGILSADMPDFQKLLGISAFKNEWFGEK